MMKWDDFIAESFRDDANRESFIERALVLMRQANLGHMSSDEIKHLEYSFALELYKTHIFDIFHDSPIETQNVCLDCAKSIFEIDKANRSVPKDVVSTAVMIWLRPDLFESDNCSDITPTSPRSEPDAFSSSINDIPAFLDFVDNRRKRKATVLLENEETSFSAQVPSDTAEIVNEIYKLRRVCDELSDEVFHRSPWVGGFFLENWDLPRK